MTKLFTIRSWLFASLASFSLALNGCAETSADDLQDQASETAATESAGSSGSEQYYTGSPELNKYVMQFVDNAKAQGLDVLPHMKGPKLSVRVASLSHIGPATIGLCELSATSRAVTFDTRFWNAASETTREILTHHELGHCVLRRPHTAAQRPTGAMASIMTPYILAAPVYAADPKYYLGELYKNSLAKSTWDDEKGIAHDQPEETHICGEDEVVGPEHE